MDRGVITASMLFLANGRVELQNLLYNGYEVAGYASNFVSSNDLFTPLAAGTNRESATQLGHSRRHRRREPLSVKK